MPTLTEEAEKSLERALHLAGERSQSLSTLEHLLLALLHDKDATELLEACKADISVMQKQLLNYVDTELTSLITDDPNASVQPTAAFQRVIQRAILFVESSGEEIVDSQDILVALFSERESYAVYFLNEQDITRYDAVNYRNHGIKKGEAPPLFSKIEVEQKDVEVEKLSTQLSESERQLSLAMKRIADLEDEVQTLAQAARTYKDEHPDIFISYQRSDREKVAPLVAALRADKFDVWWDADIVAGAPWESTIEKYISSCTIAVVCWSGNAVKSDNVKSEARYARDRNKLIQLFLDDTPPPLFFGERQGLIFKDWTGLVADDCYRDLVFHARRLLLESRG